MILLTTAVAPTAMLRTWTSVPLPNPGTVASHNLQLSLEFTPASVATQTFTTTFLNQVWAERHWCNTHCQMLMGVWDWGWPIYLELCLESNFLILTNETSDDFDLTNSMSGNLLMALLMQQSLKVGQLKLKKILHPQWTHKVNFIPHTYQMRLIKAGPFWSNVL